MLELGPAIAKKAFDASDDEVALITSAQSVGLLTSFVTVWSIRGRSPVRVSFFLQFLANLFFLPVFFLKPSWALAYTGLHAGAMICWMLSVPARVAVFRTNFPTRLRGRVVGRIRQLQLFVTTIFALLLSLALDWSEGLEAVTAWLGPCPVGAGEMVNYAIPAAAAFGVIGTLVYHGIPAVPPPDAGAPRGSLFAMVAEYWRVLRDDREFRTYEIYFMALGFVNIMTVPLTQIHVVDHLDATWIDLAMINVVLVQGVMGLTMAWWGSRIDRHDPVLLRGVLNVFLAADLVFLGIAPAIGWVYFGRVFRGIALGGGQLLWMLGALWFARDPKDAAKYTGIHAMLTGVRYLIAPFGAVLLKRWIGDDSRPIFLSGAVVLLVLGFAMVRDARRRRRGS